MERTPKRPASPLFDVIKTLVLGLALALLAWHSPKLIEAMGRLAG